MKLKRARKREDEVEERKEDRGKKQGRGMKRH
jgi:hypothetical protein